MVVLWKLSNRAASCCADWDNAEVNLLAGLANPTRTLALATRVHAVFLSDLRVADCPAPPRDRGGLSPG